MQANDMPSCPNWKKLVVILIDEMYIREDLVYDKHSGKLIGFTSLGSLHFFRARCRGRPQQPAPPCQDHDGFYGQGPVHLSPIPYVQFPCTSVSGDLLLHPFWQAVFRLERMEFKVCCMHFIHCIYVHVHVHI